MSLFFFFSSSSKSLFILKPYASLLALLYSAILSTIQYPTVIT
jgi:hypothetical protein